MLNWILLLALVMSGDSEADQYIRRGGDLAASHILVAYKGADKAPDHITRSKAEAEAKAKQLCEELTKQPERFEELAREHSDGVTASASGNLGSFRHGEMDRAFEVAVNKLDDGAITSEPVRTPFGFHIIRREAMLVKRYAARMILLTHVEASAVAGLKDMAVGQTRSREETAALMQRLAEDQSNFESLATKYTDLNRVFLGVSAVGDGDFTDWVIDIIKDLEYDQRSQIQDHEFGYILLQRVKVERRNGSMIVIEHLDAPDAGSQAMLTAKEAKKRALDICVELQSKPQRFEKLARKHSMDASARNGGKLAPWYVGSRVATIEKAFSDLAIGTISDQPIEGPRGFYILRRD